MVYYFGMINNKELKNLMADVFSSPEFEEKFTYHGHDLGATWTKDRTVFKLWAPTAEKAQVRLYRTGDPDANDMIHKVFMERTENGTWTAILDGDLNGVYYTFAVLLGNDVAEACDPYAKTTGVNGCRAMVIDLASTNPEGWDEDRDPNAGINITDAFIYELHVRDLSIDRCSGIKNKGKFLGLIESGTKTRAGVTTGLDHIKSLGVTHLHLLPFYDYGSVDESRLDKPQYNWGYDPINFNVPEGSYSTDPYHGEVRVRELKQTIKGLHDNGISVVMDVVYNHVYEAKDFCFNRLVPMYFSRVTDGVVSNGSGCGNDTASERSMVRKYIVDSVCYWADEYHIDGFRFDLVGLIDVETVNAIVTEVHKRHPNVIFYGEGWSMKTGLTKDVPLATQVNSTMTPGFAYFNDTIRDSLRGSTFITDALGYMTGAAGMGEKLESCFRGLPSWCHSPTQTINYISCHDNNTLLDRITLAVPKRSFEDRVRMYKLGAAFYMMAQGVPFMHAGEEMLRSKPNGRGGFVENSFKSPDRVNSIKWNLLKEPLYQETLAYYKGLIAFRKAHPVLRLTSSYDVLSHLLPIECRHPQLLAFHINGDVAGEPAKEMLMIFNAAETEQELNLPAGAWNVCINGTWAGTSTLETVENNLTVPPISAMVLTR